MKPPPASETRAKTTQRRGDVHEPRLPHERDQSSDSQVVDAPQLMPQAQKDIERGLKDTDRGPVMDEVYRRQKNSR